MIKEFRDFIMKGNVLDLAIAVLIAAAFGAVVSSFTNDIIMPVVGHFTGGADFANLFYALDGNAYATLDAAKEAGAAVIAYGKWINTIINFLIVAFILFLIIKAYNKANPPAPEAPPAPAGPSEIDLLTEIRDALKK